MFSFIFMPIVISLATYLWSPAPDLIREIIEHCAIWMIVVAAIWVAVAMRLTSTLLGAIALVCFIVGSVAIFAF